MTKNIWQKSHSVAKNNYNVEKTIKIHKRKKIDVSAVHGTFTRLEIHHTATKCQTHIQDVHFGLPMSICPLNLPFIMLNVMQ